MSESCTCLHCTGEDPHLVVGESRSVNALGEVVKISLSLCRLRL